MKLRVLIIAVALIGCGRKQEPPAATTGSQTAESETPKMRPSQEPQPQLPAVELPADPKRPDKIALGHALFFDKRLSANHDRACYSCHMNEDGNGGHDPIAIGSGNKKQTRHAPMIWNLGYLKGAFYWDGRAKTLEDNAKAAWGGGNMGVGSDNLDKKAAEIAAIPGYKKLFDAAGLTGKSDDVAAAIAEYERTLTCKDTAYDKFAAGDKTALTERQQKGLDVFLGKGQCLTCHAPPYFSTAMAVEGGVYFNVGIGTEVAEDQADVGRMKVTNQPADWGAFKPPSLRNVTKSPPYFHNGSVATLADAVKLMASGGIKNKNLNPALADRGLTDAERADLIAFLGALDCPGKLDVPTLP
jgi:cytochrome c peroxidase